MHYLQAENLKHKRTFVKKLLFLAPLVTILIGMLSISWFQINAYNWWYVLLCPGFLTLVCSLAEQRDRNKPLPISIKKFCYAKIGIAAIYFSVGNLIFLLLNLAGGFWICSVYAVPLAIGVLRAMAGTFCIILVSLWHIPLCLWLSEKVGIFVTIFLNCGIGSILGILAATSSFWMFCPYSWVSHLMISVLRIMPNGLPVATGVLGMSVWEILLTVGISLIWFVILIYFVTKSFENRR